MYLTYCFDLDGTLCTTVSDGRYEEANPLYDRIAEVNSLYESGHTILIETARGSQTGIDWYEITADQLSVWGVKHHKLRVGVKLAADHYIDDKGENADNFFIN
jgi:CMP-N,N'-diacetyllegionaminic acid synthase